MCVLSHFSCVQLFAIQWTIAHQAPLSMGSFRQENRSGFPCPHPEDLPNPGIKPASLLSPALAGRFWTTSATFLLPLVNFLFVFFPHRRLQKRSCGKMALEGWARSDEEPLFAPCGF